MTDFMAVGQQVARECGRVLLEMRGSINPQVKAPKDLVTEADYRSQETARRIVRDAFPAQRFLGEEDAAEVADGA